MQITTGKGSGSKIYVSVVQQQGAKVQQPLLARGRSKHVAFTIVEMSHIQYLHTYSNKSKCNVNSNYYAEFVPFHI